MHNDLFILFIISNCAVKVCPHAGGVGLCEMVQHLQMWDFTSVSCTKAERYIEYVDQQHGQFVHPIDVRNANYFAPLVRLELYLLSISSSFLNLQFLYSYAIKTEKINTVTHEIILF